MEAHPTCERRAFCAERSGGHALWRLRKLRLRLGRHPQDDAGTGADHPRGQHAQATSPEADPFARSQVVDQAGRPLVLYHGTDAEFDVFERSDDIGFHFGPRETAEARLTQAGMRNGRLMPVHVAISNPLRLPDLHTWAPNPVLAALEDAGVITGEQADAVDSVDRETVRTLLASKGYDGIVYANKTEGGGDSYIAFRPEQITNADKPIAPIAATWERVI